MSELVKEENRVPQSLPCLMQLTTKDTEREDYLGSISHGCVVPGIPP